MKSRKQCFCPQTEVLPGPRRELTTWKHSASGQRRQRGWDPLLVLPLPSPGGSPQLPLLSTQQLGADFPPGSLLWPPPDHLFPGRGHTPA